MEPRSYAEMNPPGPGVLPLLMPGAKNLMDYVSLSAGEYVLVLAEHAVHPEVPPGVGGAADAMAGFARSASMWRARNPIRT